MSHQEIGQVLGVSRERVRQIEAQALRKLRRSGKLKSMLALANQLEAGRGLECRVVSGRRRGLGE